ncbi:hypothetical protein EXN66_Car013823 [Channa argus]|uniref:Ig-like domain-containing protein n=1 Tax=Channa argus TaxID=215402 RepID=A0A6G1Q6K4_CHAAH|nr:hypothetical protein EXN66_Car013823 [Channa argus]
MDCLTNVYRAFSIIPTRLQLFEYEAVSFSCEGFNVSTGWKVKNIKESISKCSDGPVTSGITCTIPYAFETDSGEYWCEGEGGGRSNTVTINVNAFHRETIFSHLNYTLLCTAIAVVVTLQMLVIGLLYWKKQLVLLEVKMNDPNKDMYTADKKKKGH